MPSSDAQSIPAQNKKAQDSLVKAFSYQPPPPPPPPPPPDEPPPSPPELDPGAVDEDEMALLSEVPRFVEKPPMSRMFQPGPAYHAGA